jgi:hypothetical protein
MNGVKMAEYLTHKLALTHANHSGQLMHNFEMVRVPLEPMHHQNFLDNLAAEKIIPYLF